MFNVIGICLYFKFDFLFNFLINYHIYIYLGLLGFTFLYIGVFLYKYGLLYIIGYIYSYWFIYINTIFFNLCVIFNFFLLIYDNFVIKVLSVFNFILIDLKSILFDFFFYVSGAIHFFNKPKLFIENIKLLFTQLNDRRKYILKKYVYTINHKRIAINYFFFSMWTALSGGALATMIRLELAFPGSPFFKGDSTRYLQTITAHGLIMVFFVVVPILFGGFANFLIPYHVGSKDVAYPRLNSIGF